MTEPPPRLFIDFRTDDTGEAAFGLAWDLEQIFGPAMVDPSLGWIDSSSSTE